VKKTIFFQLFLAPFLLRANVQIFFTNAGTTAISFQKYSWSYTIPNQNYSSGVNTVSTPVELATGGSIYTEDLEFNSSDPADVVNWNFTGTLADGSMVAQSGTMLPLPGASATYVNISPSKSLSDIIGSASSYVSLLKIFGTAVLLFALAARIMEHWKVMGESTSCTGILDDSGDGGSKEDRA